MSVLKDAGAEKLRISPKPGTGTRPETLNALDSFNQTAFSGRHHASWPKHGKGQPLRRCRRRFCNQMLWRINKVPGELINLWKPE